MEKRACGRLGIEVSVLGIGCWSFGGGDYWGAQEESDVRAVVHAALDHGVTYFDVAETYNAGRSEESLGRALKGRRAEAVIGSKVSPSHTEPAVLRAHCEASLRRLQTDYVDLYMVHWPITQYSVNDAFATLRDLQSEGKIRAIGVSNFGVQQLAEALDMGAPIQVNQLCYNLLSRAIEVGILPLCRRKGIAVLGYMPLMQGLLTCKYRTPDEMPDVRVRATFEAIVREHGTARRERRRRSSGLSRASGLWLKGRKSPWDNWRWPGLWPSPVSRVCWQGRARYHSSARTSRPARSRSLRRSSPNWTDGPNLCCASWAPMRTITRAARPAGSAERT